MRVWIDAAPAAAALKVLGMTPVERHLIAAGRAGIAPQDIVIDGGSRPAREVRALAGPALVAQPVRIVNHPGDVATRLQAELDASETALIALSGDTVVDPRLLKQLASETGAVIVTDNNAVERALPQAFALVYGTWTETGDGTTCVLRLEPGSRLPPAATLDALGTGLLNRGSIRHFSAAGRDHHLAMQRRDVPFWIRRVTDSASRNDVERFLFDASYKGSTDVLTRHVLPYAVWPLVLWCTRYRIHPNLITAVSIVATLAAAPCFAWGWWIAGLSLAWLMSVLDSVDGKVARLTLTDSKLGEVLDHGLDIVHPPIWYFGWAIGLSGLDPVASLIDGRIFAVPVFQAAILMLALYVADRLVLAIYKLRFRRGLHSHARIDGIVRGIISRRNVNLALFTLAMLVGWGIAAFYVVVAWQLVTVLWHALRTAWILGRREMPPVAT